MTKYAIETNGLSVYYGRHRGILDVDLRVEEGEIFGFLGPNGAGKTTTVRMLTGVLEPTDGTATIQGHDIRKQSLATREHLGIVPEEANVYLDLSVWQNVMLMAELHGVPRRQRTREGQRLLDLLGLGDRKSQKARALSKGLRQRLMLCLVLLAVLLAALWGCSDDGSSGPPTETVSVTYKVSLKAAEIEAVGSVSGAAVQVAGGEIVGPKITVQGEAR